MISKVLFILQGQNNSMENTKDLLAITELGGYPDFSDVYTKYGFHVVMENSMRKALRSLKKNKPDVVVAEFNFQSDFRDRTSSLETLMAVLQQMDGVKVIIFFEKEYLHQFEKLLARFSFHAELSYPIDRSKLEMALQST